MGGYDQNRLYKHQSIKIIKLDSHRRAFSVAVEIEERATKKGDWKNKAEDEYQWLTG